MFKMQIFFIQFSIEMSTNKVVPIDLLCFKCFFVEYC